MPDIISSVKIVGRYELLDPIGQGGMAIVYLAHQTDLDRRVALKELRVLNAPDDPALAERFLREARMAGSMSHPNIVTVYEYFKHDGTPYIAMEYIRRGSLRPWIGRMTLAQIVGVMEGLLAALDHAQGYRIVHRDLKPENLLVTDQGQIKVADFGIAKARTMETNAFLTAVGTTVGTPTYMAPEQAMAQELGPYTDLYSVGVMAYEMLVGRAPFSDTSTPFAVVMRHLNEQIPSAYKVKPEIDRALSGWIDRLLIKDPAKRTQTAEEAWDELEQFVVRLLGSLWRREARLVQTSELPSAQPLTPAPFASTDIETPVPEKRDDRSRGEDYASDGPDVSAPVSEPAFPTSEHRVPVARSPDLGAQLDDLAQPDAAQLDYLARPDAPPAPALRPDSGFVTFDRNVRAPAREQLPDRSAQPVGLVTPPSVAQPVVEPPVVEQPVVEQPVVEQPVVEQPVVEAPAARRVQEQPAPVREQPPAARTAGPPASTPHDDPGLSRDMKAAPAARVPNSAPIAPYAPAEPSAPDFETVAPFEFQDRRRADPPPAPPSTPRVSPDRAQRASPPASPDPAQETSRPADPGPTPAETSSAPARPAPARATSPAAPAPAPASRMSPPASSEPAQRASPPASPKRARKTSSAVGPKPAKRTSRTDPAAKAGMRVGLTRAPDGEDHTIPAGEASAPAPATSPPRTPARGDPGRRAMIGGGVAVLAVAGVAVVLVVGGGGGGSAPPKTPAAINSHTVPLTTADLSLAAPPTWSPRADLPRIPGLDPNRAKAIARGRAYLAAELVPGATDPTLLPRDLLHRLKVKLPAPVKLTLGGNDAYRYDALQAHGIGAKLRVYTVLTNAGVATIACSSPATRADCDAVAKTLKLSSAQALPMGADRAYEAIVTSASTALDGAVATQNKGLDRAKTLRGKASALRKIGRAYAAAASLLGGPGARKSAQDAARTLNPVDARLNSGLIKVLGKAASAYGKLATAVGRGDRRATDRSARVAGRATRSIRATAGALNRAGYTTVPSVYPRTNVTLPARPTARSVTPPAATGPAPSQSHFTPPPQSQTPPPPAAQRSTPPPPPPPPPPPGSGSGSGGD